MTLILPNGGLILRRVASAEVAEAQRVRGVSGGLDIRVTSPRDGSLLTPFSRSGLCLTTQSLSTGITRLRRCRYSTRHMNNLSDLSVFESLFQSALEEYEKQTGIDLAKHPFAAQLECCDSVESITQALQDRAEAFVKFRGNSKVTTLIKNSVQILHKLSTTVAYGEIIGLVTLVRAKMADQVCISLYLTLLQPIVIPLVRTIHTGIGALLSVCTSAFLWSNPRDVQV